MIDIIPANHVLNIDSIINMVKDLSPVSHSGGGPHENYRNIDYATDLVKFTIAHHVYNNNSTDHFIINSPNFNTLIFTRDEVTGVQWGILVKTFTDTWNRLSYLKKEILIKQISSLLIV